MMPMRDEYVNKVISLYVAYYGTHAPFVSNGRPTKAIDFCVDCEGSTVDRPLLAYSFMISHHWKLTAKTFERVNASSNCSVSFFPNELYSTENSRIHLGRGSCRWRQENSHIARFGREMKAINVFFTNRSRL